MLIYLKSTIDLMLKNNLNEEVQELINTGTVKQLTPELIYLVIEKDE